MSARDSESGSSSYKGGSRSAGGLGNGGIGGGRGGGGNFGGGMGGGAGRIGGIGSRTGLTTGTKMVGTPGRDGLSATGRPGGMAQNPGAWGMRPQSSIARGTLGAPTAAPAVPGLLGEPVAVPVAGVNPVPEYVPAVPFQDPMAIYATLKPPREAPIPPSGLMFGNGRMWPGQGVTPQTQAATYRGPSGYWQQNPTAQPQWSTGWKNETSNYRFGNSYPGGFEGHTGRLSNDDTRLGIDRMARDRSNAAPRSSRGWGGWNSLGFN